MIAKCKTISHGKEMINYAMRDTKMELFIASNMVMGKTPDEIFEEMEAVNRYADRCKNKYLRFEIGIAPRDEGILKPEHLTYIATEFAKRMGLENQQWIACTHKDTDNLHIHLVANRIGIDGKTYNADFVSNRSAHAAEMISRDIGLTIAKDVQREKEYVKTKGDPSRQAVKIHLQKIAYESLGNCKNPIEFITRMGKQGVNIEFVRNKKGKVYGMRFNDEGYTFKASEVGREFGLRTLYNQYGYRTEDQKSFSSVPKYHPKLESQPIPIAQAVSETLLQTHETTSEVLSAVFGLLDVNNGSTPDQRDEPLWKAQLRKKKKGRGM